MLASTPEGLQCLQYDGWRFEKCKTHLKNVTNDTIKDVNALHYGKLRDKNVLGKLNVSALYAGHVKPKHNKGCFDKSARLKL